MIQIDRSSRVSVQEQLTEQLRYLIASNHFRTGERLPSTRALADQLGLSFHTVRKAYQQLEEEALVSSKVGSGFRVLQHVPPAKGERMERGAAMVQDALQRLIALGLQEQEIEYLFQEQLSLLSNKATTHKVVFVAPFRELAERGAEQLTAALQQHVEAVVASDVERHQDADYAFTRYQELHGVLARMPRTDVHGVLVYVRPDALGPIARLLGHQTLGLVTRYPDAIAPLTEEIRDLTTFSGQIVAASAETQVRHLASVVEQCDVLTCTPQARRRLQPYLNGRSVTPMTFQVSTESLEEARRVVPA